MRAFTFDRQGLSDGVAVDFVQGTARRGVLLGKGNGLVRVPFAATRPPKVSKGRLKHASLVRSGTAGYELQLPRGQRGVIVRILPAVTWRPHSGVVRTLIYGTLLTGPGKLMRDGLVVMEPPAVLFVHMDGGIRGVQHWALVVNDALSLRAMTQQVYLRG